MNDEQMNEKEPVVEELFDAEIEPVEVVEGEVVEGEVIEGELVEGEVEQDELVEEEAAEPTLEERLEQAEAEAAKNLDSYLRAQAELANARKRFEKQRAQTYVNANADIVSKLLPVIDDYERAIETVPPSISEDPWYAGIELVYRKLLGVLDTLHVQEIAAVGEPFDPRYHEALAQEPSEELESGSVTRVMQKGYQIGDRVIRPSLVYVAE